MPRKSKAAAAAEDGGSAAPPRRSSRIRKYVVYPDDVEGEPTPKKPRGKRASATNVSYEEEDNSNEPSKDSSSKDDEFDPNEDADEQVEKAKTPARGRGRGRKSAAAHKDTPAPKAAGRGRGRKRLAAPEPEEDQDDGKERKGHKKQKFEDVPEDQDEKEEQETETAKASVVPSDKDPGVKGRSPDKNVGSSADKKESEQKSTDGEKKKQQVGSGAVPEKPSGETAKDKTSATKCDPAMTNEGDKSESLPNASKEDTKKDSATPAELAKESTAASTTTESELKEAKAKENGVKPPAAPTCEVKTAMGYEPNKKSDAPVDKDVSVASFVAPTAGDVVKETKEVLEKAEGAEVVAVQKASPATADAAESCGFQVIGSGATCLFVRPSCVKAVGQVETGSLGALAHRELDNLSSQVYRASVEAYLTAHCCPTDEFTVATLSVRGKSFILVNVQMETKNVSVAALLIGCLMRHLDSHPNAFILTGHMPFVWPDRPAYELLRDGYFGDGSIETLLKMQEIRMDGEGESVRMKGLIDFLWKAYQHCRPLMRSVYEIVLNGENSLSVSGRSMLWHSTAGVGVVGVLSHPALVKADLAFRLPASQCESLS